MSVDGHIRHRARAVMVACLVAVCGTAGCYSPQTRDSYIRSPAPLASSDLVAFPERSPSGNPLIVPAPRSQDAQALVATPSSIETWIAHTRACEQKLGSDPWSSITIGRLDELGGPIHGADPEALLARMAGRPSVIFVHGNGYTYRDAVDEAVKIRGVLEANGGFPPETLFIVFDWPSELERGDLIVDLNEKARRSRVAAYHLSRLLQSSPPDSRICLLGQSNGARIVLNTLHLLSGAPMRAFWSEPEVQLSSGRPDLRLRAVVLEAAAGHHWLNPGERLDQALPMCESLFVLRNCADYALSVYIFGVYTGLRPALGQVGLLSSDLRNLGPLATRVEQVNLHSRVGLSHTSYPRALALPDIAERIARYTSWNDVISSASR
jgi:predicted esterase